MKKFNIEIEEVLQRAVEVEAENKENAIRLAEEKYRNEEIVLDSEDLKSIIIK